MHLSNVVELDGIWSYSSFELAHRFRGELKALGPWGGLGELNKRIDNKRINDNKNQFKRNEQHNRTCREHFIV